MSKRQLIRVVVLLLLIGLIVAFWLSPLRDQLSRDRALAVVEQLRGLWYGPLAFVGGFTLACVLALPASVFVLAAGLIWGWQLGALYSIAGGVLGAVASFGVGRFVGDGLLERFGRAGELVRKRIDHAGFRSLLVLRFIPGIPFAVLNYGAGVAGVRFRDYLPATLIGVIPPMFVFAYCADALFNGSMSEGDAVWRLLVVCGLMLAIILLPQAVKRLSSRGAEVPSERP